MKKAIIHSIIGLIAFMLCVAMFMCTVTPAYAAYDEYEDASPVRTEESAKNYAGLLKQIKRKDYWGKTKKNTIDELKKGKSAAKFATTTINSVVNLVNDWDNADYADEFYGILEDGVKLTVACFGYGGVADAVFDVFDTCLSIGENSESELKQLEARLNDNFDEVNGHIDEIQRDISELSNQVGESTETILKALSRSLNAYYAQTKVSDFYSSSNGNFNYAQFKNYIYGSTDPEQNPLYWRQSYYNKLLESISQGAPGDVIKENYDSLYRSLESLQTHGDTAINTYYGYLLFNEGSGNESIQHNFYDYISANESMLQSLIGDDPVEQKALEFTLDLYTTALFADYCIEMCSTYQILQLVKTYGSDLDMNSKYYFGSGDNDYITYGDILQIEAEIIAKEDLLEKQMASDVAYILHLGESFITEAGEDIWVSLNSNTNTFGQVLSDQTIYLNKLDDDICSSFDFNLSDFTYTWKNNLVVLSVEDSFQTAKGTDCISSKVEYQGKELYTINFNIDNYKTFNGGNGTIDDPYLISNVEQMYLISSESYGYSKSYKLISDIDFQGLAFSSIGNEDEPFTGMFDGNGHIIHNLSMNGSTGLGLFGAISKNSEEEPGTVKNLKLDNCKFTVVSDEEKTVVGAISAICDGIIYNCEVSNLTISSETLGSFMNKNISSYVGGISGECSGVITYSRVTGTSEISGKSIRDYKTNADEKNKNDCYVGGIVAVLVKGGSIDHCAVMSSVSVTAYAYSDCYDNMSTRHPYVKAYAGGIAVLTDDITKIKNVFSATNATSDGGAKNGGWIGEEIIENNIYKECDIITIGINDEQRNTISASVEDTVLSISDDIDIVYSFNTLLNESYGYCYEGQLYSCGEQQFKTEKLLISVNGKKAPNKLIGYYGFNTINHNTQNYDDTKRVSVLLWVEVDGQDYMKKMELPITIMENRPTGIEINIPANADKIEYNGVKYLAYENGEKAFSKGETALLVYQDGTTQNVTNLISASGSTNVLGKNKIVAEYEGFSAEYDIVVKCNHDYVTESPVPPTCTKMGFTNHVCSICGNSYKTDIVPKIAHTETLINNRVETCCVPGYTGDVICSVCHRLLEQGTEIDTFNHEYDENHADNTYHWCNKDCDSLHTLEPHNFVTIENGNGTILYRCIDCGYHYTEQKDLTKLARVIVSDSYALKGKEVTVYVQLLNNPGITGASCSINYDNRLMLVSCEQDTILLDADPFTVTYVRPGLCAVTMGRDNADTSIKGNLLKLVFIVPEDIEIGEVLGVSISYSKSKEQFTDAQAKAIDIITFAGEITIVERLPGDVNGDELVDILDAVLISLQCNNIDGVNDNLLNNANFDSDFADIDLSGEPGLGDLITILQHLVGGYDTQVHSNDYKVTLNPNDGVHQATMLTVTCFEYGINGKVRCKFGELPQLERPGYRFDGWYTRADINDPECRLITADSYVTYDDLQYQQMHKQMLYAHWTLNKVDFDGNGATSGSMRSATYIRNGEWLDVANAYEKILRIGYGDIKYQTVNYTQDVVIKFLGWSLTPNGDIITKPINLKNSIDGVGTITLYAVWSSESIQLPSTQKTGQEFLGWYIGNRLVGKARAGYTVTDDVELDARWKTIEYSIEFNGNGNTNNLATYQQAVEQDGQVTLEPNKFEKTGYHLDGWSTTPNGGLVYKDKAVVSYLAQTQNQVIMLYAHWVKNEYKVIYNGNGATSGTMVASVHEYDTDKALNGNMFNRDGYKFVGWAISPNSGEVYTNGAIVKNLSEINNSEYSLYAVWKVASYSVVLNVNGGEISTGNVTEYTYGTLVELPISVQKSGYVFAGWFDANNGQGNYYSYIPSTMFGDVYLYAHWVQLQTYQLTVDDTAVSLTHQAKKQDISGDSSFTVTVPEELRSIKNTGHLYVKVTANCTASLQFRGDSGKVATASILVSFNDDELTKIIALSANADRWPATWVDPAYGAAQSKDGSLLESYQMTNNTMAVKMSYEYIVSFDEVRNWAGGTYAVIFSCDLSSISYQFYIA